MKAALILLFCLAAFLATSGGNGNVTKCEPGTTFKRRCNDCTCTSEGVPACTKKACPPERPTHVPRVARAATQECVPGTSYKKECNDCFCTDNGVEACTKMDCVQVAAAEAAAAAGSQ